MSITREQAIKIAQACAYAKHGGHSYTPKSPVEARHFEPHEWVIDAIMNAYADGMQAQRDIQHSGHGARL